MILLQFLQHFSKIIFIYVTFACGSGHFLNFSLLSYQGTNKELLSQPL